MSSSNQILKMLGLEGHQEVQVPSNYQQEYPFVTIVNMTDNSISIYPANTTTPTAGLALYTWGAYQSMTVPITPDIQTGFSIVWTNPHNTNTDKLKTAQVIFSKSNLGYNQSFAPSFAMASNVLYTALVNDQIGLLTADDFADYKTDFGVLLNVINAIVSGSASAKVLPIGTSFKQQLTQVAAVDGILTFTDPITAVEIINTDAVNPGIFTVNGISINITAGGSFKAVIGGTPSAIITISGAASYIVNSFI